MAFESGTSVYDYLMQVREKRGAGFFVLLDPDRAPSEKLAEQVKSCEDAGVDAILVGTSLMMGNGFHDSVAAISEAVSIPIIIFPGEKSQVANNADAILFLSLLSGRNPELIIGEQVKSAPQIKSIGLEAMSTAYLLVESGRMTSVEYMSNTKPIPAEKPEIALAHAVTAEMFGMKFIYLEAGSGAERPVPDDMVKAVSSGVDTPVIVGGGLRTPEAVKAKVAAGASFVVVGNHLERQEHHADLVKLVEAAHG